MKLSMEEVNSLVCKILDRFNDEIGLSVDVEDQMFDILQEEIDSVVGKGDYANYN